MKIEINEREVIADAVAKVLTPEVIAAELEKAIAEEMKSIRCLTVKQAAKELHIGVKAFRALGIPRAFLGDKTFRYRATDIDTYLAEHTANPRRRRRSSQLAAA